MDRKTAIQDVANIKAGFLALAAALAAIVTAKAQTSDDVPDDLAKVIDDANNTVSNDPTVQAAQAHIDANPVDPTATGAPVKDVVNEDGTAGKQALPAGGDSIPTKPPVATTEPTPQVLGQPQPTAATPEQVEAAKSQTDGEQQ